MAVRPINLYNSYDSTSNGTIYYNSGTNLFYSDAECTQQIGTVPVPRRSQYTFTGYRASSSDTAALRVDANGVIIPWSAGTSTSEMKIYSRWTILSNRFYVTPAGDGVTNPWVIPDPEFYRAIAGGDLYRDDQLTNGPITSIRPPYRAGAAFRGCWYENESSVVVYNYIDKDGNLLSDLRTRAAGSSYQIGMATKWYTCYKATLNANGGTGGEVNPIWYDRVQGRWCSDDTLQNVITTVTKPTQNGKIFKGYYTAQSGGTQVVGSAGNIKASWTSVTSASTTVYAQWANPVTITVNHGGGSGTVSNLYYGGGVFFDSAALTNPVTSIPVPTLANHRFLGYYSGSTQVIGTDGAISSSWSPSAAVTITAQWERVSYTVNIEGNGGGGVSVVYANAVRTALYADEMCSGTALTGITPLTRAGYRFLGLYATNSVSGTLLVNRDGTFTTAMASFLAGLTGATTIYALWQQVITIGLDQQGGTGGVDEIYYEDAYGNFYDSPAMDTPVTNIAVPVRECWAFGGYYTGTGGSGTQRIAASGSIVSGYAPTANETLYAKWTRRSYKYAFNANGGTVGTPAIYCNGSTAAFYADDALTQAISSITKPTRPGYTFTGYANGGTQVVNASGSIVLASAFGADATATAGWTANTYTLVFDYNGGSGSTQQKTVTFGQPVGTLPNATRARAYFKGWVVNGALISSTTVWDVPSNTTALALWDLQFGGVTDWFGLGGSNLIPIASSSGDNKQRLCVAHYGKFESGVNAIGGIWRNPSVTYQVVRDVNFRCTLGKAYGSGSGISGYMITSAEVQTAIGKFPTITVRGVANEGANAINQFAFAVTVRGRARAQNLLSAVSGGGQLQSCNLSASCEPVVIAENNMPCASDVVNGKMTVGAALYAPNGESAPTASGGFTSIGEPKECGDKNYTMWNITAEKEM